MIIKSVQTINIHYGDSEHEVWIQHPDLREMVQADALQDLPEILDIMFAAKSNAALQYCLDSAKILYRLGKQ